MKLFEDGANWDVGGIVFVNSADYGIYNSAIIKREVYFLRLIRRCLPLDLRRRDKAYDKYTAPKNSRIQISCSILSSLELTIVSCQCGVKKVSLDGKVYSLFHRRRFQQVVLRDIGSLRRKLDVCSI